LAVTLFGVDFFAEVFAGCFFAEAFVAAVFFFAGLRDAIFVERAGAIGLLHLDYQMYQMRVRVGHLSSLWHRVSMVGCVIVPD
jgi:hypothetical protein